MTTVVPHDLAAAVHGPVLCASDAGFTDACRGFNLTGAHAPEVAVLATGAADVSAAVTWAADHGQPVAVHATGHGSGLPAEAGMLVNTGRMRRVAVDPESRTAQVAAGVRWQDVIEAAAPYGLAPLCGSSPGVGVVGYTLGGGMGPMARTFGFAADHVRSIELVTADGALVTVTESSEPELFWALRGGKCSLGIVTAMEFDLMPVSAYYGGGIFFGADDAERVLHEYPSWAAALPESATTSVALLRLPDLPPIPPPLRGVVSAHLRFLHVGEPARGAELVAPMRALAAPLIDTVSVTPFAQIGSVHADPVDPMPARDDSLLLRDLPGAAVDAMLGAVGPGVSIPLMVTELRHMGGAVARGAAVPNAVGGREASFNLMTVGPYPPPLRGAVDAAAVAAADAMRPWATGSRLINFQGWATAPEDVRRAWPEETSRRLRAVTEAWDPDGVFRFGYRMTA